MPPVVAIVGASDSGKTTVAAALVREFTARGLRVAAIKHCPHGHGPSPGSTDSERLSDAGAEVAVAASPGRLTIVDRRIADPPLHEIVRQLGPGFDLVVAEGYKSSAVPKILVQSEKPLPAELTDLAAVVGNDVGEHAVPHFSRNDTENLATWIESRLIAQEDEPGGVRLTVDGVDIPLNRFPSEALAGMVHGFIQSLRGVPLEPGSVELTVSRRLPGAREDDNPSNGVDASFREALRLLQDRGLSDPAPE